ncbi:centromere protein J isoform X2 [Fukomys damarensis]|uniref:centromere protein J isoform X2 n=1 Tax=Fukomys damarensis TaxID=885580 RepID=UPI00053F67DE|nr:centromere protein J isoform X2 [Fukomys damarensis]
MLTSHLEAIEGVEVSPVEDPGPGARADLEDITARVPIEDLRTEQMLQQLQHQVSDLRVELRKQAAQWSVAHSELQDQIDALTKQNLALQQELRARGSQGAAATEKLSASLPRTCGSRALGVHKPSRLLGESSGRKSPAQASDVPLQEKKAPASKKDTYPSVPESSKARLPGQGQARRPPRFSADRRVEQVELTLSDGRMIVTFPNGTRKETSTDKKTTIIKFYNGDVKKIKPDQRVIYYFSDAQTTYTTYPDGVETVQFPNKQIEKFYPDGSKETAFPDGTVTRLKAGCEETVFPDGTITHVKRNGDKTIVFSNGQKEIHTAQFKRREFPDGTSKTVYCNGCQETKYSSGRVKVKDQTGKVILDQKQK